MTHYTDSLARLPIFKGDHNIILSCFPAEEINRIKLLIGGGIIGGENKTGAVINADNCIALVIAEVEPIDVVSS